MLVEDGIERMTFMLMGKEQNSLLSGKQNDLLVGDFAHIKNIFANKIVISFDQAIRGWVRFSDTKTNELFILSFQTFSELMPSRGTQPISLVTIMRHPFA